MLDRNILEKWKSVIESPKHGKLNEARQIAMAIELENSATTGVLQEAKRIRTELGLLNEQFPTNVMGTSSSTAGTGNIDTFDPILISLIRRTTPNLIAYDLCGVQPMTGPAGLIFALRTRYGNMTGTENYYNEVNTGWTGWPGANMTSNGAGSTISGGYGNNTVMGGANGNLGTMPGVSNNAGNSTYNFGGGFPTAAGEGLGFGNSIFPEMGFSIEKTSVTARERGLKAEWSIELAQDLKAIHGLDAEAELTSLLSTELLAEINREVIRTIVIAAKPGAQTGTTTAGIFDLDVDADGRWLVEKFKGLMFRLELEANAIAKATRRGKGNVILCSSNIASALMAAGFLSYTPKLDANSLMIDDTGNTFAGVLNGKYKVYIDPYATGDYMVMGYKGSNAFDAGIFYCPYVPLQMLKAQDPNTFQPKIAFKTRYGMVSNPFAEGLTVGQGRLLQDSNVFYTRTIVNNLM